MKKPARPRFNREFRRLRGMTQVEVAELAHTTKSNIANAELSKKPFSPRTGGAPYSLFYGVSNGELMGVAPDFSYSLLGEPGIQYESSEKIKDQTVRTTYYANFGAEPKQPLSDEGISSFAKGKRFFVPKTAKLRLCPKIAAEELIDQSLMAFRSAAGASLKSLTPVSLQSCLHRKFDTDCLIWHASEDIPEIGVFRGAPLVIRPQTYYPKDRLVLCSDGVEHYFIGQIVEPNQSVYNVRDKEKRIMPIAENRFEIVGRLLMAYSVF